MNNERITIITDTASSITQKEADKKGIGLVPVNIIVDGNEFNESTLPPEELYQILGKKRITTTAPNPDEISKTFQQYYDLGGRKFLFIALSSKNSSIYQNTYLASREFQEAHPDSKIEVVDSKAICLTQSFKVDKALEMANSGFSMEDIKTRIGDLSKNMVLYCSGNDKTAKFIFNSGRVHGVDRFKALTASAFSHLAVPFITMNPNDGSVSSEIVRGSEERGIKEMVRRISLESDHQGQQPNKFAIAYTQDKEIGQNVIELLSRRFDLNQTNLIQPKEAGSSLAVHVGPRIAILSAVWN